MEEACLGVCVCVFAGLKLAGSLSFGPSNQAQKVYPQQTNQAQWFEWSFGECELHVQFVLNPKVQG